MRYVIILVSVLTIQSLGLSATLNVPGTYNTIQDAINAAVNGDTVLVHPGTYVENIDFLGKAIVVESLDGPQDTIINGMNPVNPDFGSTVSFKNGEGLDSVLDGFTVTGGSRTLISGHEYGGNIFCHGSGPTIKNNVITKAASSTKLLGGGISCINHSSPAILDNTIDDHVAYEGGGIYCYDHSSPLIFGNDITGNWCDTPAGIGGGIFCTLGCDPTICGNTISDNRADTGCAISVIDQCIPVIAGNLICMNHSVWTASGIFCDGLYGGTIKDNRIIGNQAVSWAGSGGGIFCIRSSDLYIVNNIISENRVAENGGGIYCSRSDLTVLNCTIRGNITYKFSQGGGGIYCTDNSTMDIVNTIVWDNDKLFKNQIYLGKSAAPSTINISYSDVMGGANPPYVSYAPGCVLNWGSGMIDADPLFVDLGNGDLHLTYPSPCRDTGDNIAVTGLYDFEGDPRIAYGIVDMGADEFHPHLYWTGDAAPGGNVALKFVGLPGTTPVQLWLGSGIMDPPMTTKYGYWFLQFPLLVTIPNLGPIPSNGVYLLPVTLPGNLPAPLSLPLQSGIGMELTNLSVMEVE